MVNHDWVSFVILRLLCLDLLKEKRSLLDIFDGRDVHQFPAMGAPRRPEQSNSIVLGKRRFLGKVQVGKGTQVVAML
jgi:hypothetical protein